jgi:hypothetical protein
MITMVGTHTISVWPTYEIRISRPPSNGGQDQRLGTAMKRLALTCLDMAGRPGVER